MKQDSTKTVVAAPTKHASGTAKQQKSFPEDFLVVAHRGGKNGFKENSLECFLHALSAGSNALEMDVRFDHIGKRFYLEHDFFHAPGAKSNLLENVLQHLPRETVLFIELKTLAWLRKNLARHFLPLIQKYQLEQRAVIISFNPFVLFQLKSLAPELRLGFLCGNPFWSFFFRAIIFPVLKPAFLLLHRRMMRSSLFRFGRQHKLKILMYQSDKEKHLQLLKDLDIQGIITDYPEKVLGISK